MPAADVLTIENSRSGDEMIAALALYGYKRDLGATLRQLIHPCSRGPPAWHQPTKHITNGQRQAAIRAMTGDMPADLCSVWNPQNQTACVRARTV